jgi:hypothetical protein
MELLLHPFAIWIALAVSLLACLALFFSAKREGARRQKLLRESVEGAEARFRAALESLESRCRHLEERTDAFVAPPPPLSGLNFSKRSQALQMHRRGDPPERIAAALPAPRNEVDLLLKVHSILISSELGRDPGRPR